MKRNASDYGSSRPKLTQEDFDGDFIVLTIASVEEVTVDDEDKEEGKRKSLVLTFDETGDKSLWLNVSQINALIERFGEDDDDWKGERVPVEKHTAEYMGKKYPKVRIMAAEEWDEALGTRKAKKKAGAAKGASNSARRGRR